MFSFVRICFPCQMRLVGDHHFYIANQSPGLCIGVELHRITCNVELCALDCCPLLHEFVSFCGLSTAQTRDLPPPQSRTASAVTKGTSPSLRSGRYETAA